VPLLSRPNLFSVSPKDTGPHPANKLGIGFKHWFYSGFPRVKGNKLPLIRQNLQELEWQNQAVRYSVLKTLGIR
jgi:hypothetical protein